MSGDIIRLPGAQMELIGQGMIYRIPSRTRPHVRHLTVIQLSHRLEPTTLPEARVLCSCESTVECWHMTAAWEQYQADLKAIGKGQ